jgi:hypothetical protein
LQFSVLRKSQKKEDWAGLLVFEAVYNRIYTDQPIKEDYMRCIVTLAGVLALSASAYAQTATNQTMGTNQAGGTNQSGLDQAGAVDQGAMNQTNGSQGAQNGGTQAAQSTGSQAAQNTEQGNTMTIIVQNVDQQQKKISAIGSESKQIQLSLSGNAQIIDPSGQSRQLADLKSGQRIRVSYLGSKQSPEVCKIEILTG